MDFDDGGGSTGLRMAEARERLLEYGPNELPQARRESLLRLVAEVLGEPMSLLLLACGGLYLVLGEVGDALVLLGFVGVLLAIEIVQKQRTDTALQALQALSSPRALVIRDGQRQRVAGREVVPGDWVVLSEGDRIPADGFLVDAHHIEIDESLLTGESLPVRKSMTHSDSSARICSGTLVVRGHGVAIIDATGARTEIGRIGHVLQSTAVAATPLQKETAALVRIIALLAAMASIGTALAYGLLRGNWSDAALAGIALAMTLLPSEFPVVLAVFLGMGAWRLARVQVLARRTSAIEALGAATVLCVDKTGTLTENRMRVGALVIADGTRYSVGSDVLPEPAHRLVEYAILATRQDPFDPMEGAIRALGVQDFVDSEHLHSDWRMLREYPLSSGLMAMSQVWETRREGRRCIAAKGAPEAIAELCHLDARQAAALAEQAEELSSQGLRVIAVATAHLTHDAIDVQSGSSRLPPAQHDFAFELLGLLGLHDPVRTSVPAAVAACTGAGIRVMMITGDHPGTATAIAESCGIAGNSNVLLGSVLEQLTDEQLAERLRTVHIIARARPEQKLRVVRALQAQGEVVGMTGDGVNDALALSAADIGIAMGQRGTAVAREAADLVIADDDFGSIVNAVRAGRRIDRNLRRAMLYLVAAHLPIAGVAMTSVLLGWPLLLLPIHIAFLELLIDPACSLVFEATADDDHAMKQPPRRLQEPLFGRSLVLRALAQGGLALLAVIGLALEAHARGEGADHLRTLVFVMLVLANLAMIVGANRLPGHPAASRNWPLRLITPVAFLALILVVDLPELSHLFRLAPATSGDWLRCLMLALPLALAVRWIDALGLQTVQERSPGRSH